MKTMKKSRIILAIVGTVAIIIIIGILMFANLLFGNPISKSIAKRQVKNYLEAVYSDSSINNSYYNLVSDRYVFECTIEGEQRDIACKNKRIKDEYVDSYYKDEFYKDLASIELNDMNVDAYIDPYIIADGEYSTDFDELNLDTIMLLNIVSTSSYDSGIGSKKAAAMTVKQIVDALNDRYSINRIDVWYTDAFGSYNVEFQHEEFTVEKFLAKIQGVR